MDPNIIKIIDKLIDDTFWFCPEWFQNELSKIPGFLTKIKDYEYLASPSIPIGPIEAALYASKKHEKDPHLYLRALGFQSKISFLYLHPVIIYCIANGIEEERANQVINKFHKDLARFSDIMPVVKVNLNEFSHEELEKNCEMLQSAACEYGKKIWQMYTQLGNGMFLDVQCVIEAYANIVNFNYYCWRLTMSDEFLSYGKDFDPDTTKATAFMRPKFLRSRDIWLSSKKWLRRLAGN